MDAMRAARLWGKEDLRIEEVPLPSLGHGEVLVRVKAAAICGTDIRMFRSGRPAASAGSPLILGHEIAGVLEAAGPGVRGYEKGMRIAVAPNMGCGVCDRCVSGNTQLCDSFRAFGINIDGGFAEYVLVPEAAVRQGNLSEIPEGLDFVQAALAEPLSCVLNAFERCAIGPGDVVLVIGAGPIGMMHVKLAFMGGASRVLMNDLNPERLRVCATIEPRIVAVPPDELKTRVMAASSGRGADVIITANPSPEAQVVAVELAALGGRVMFFGGLPAGRSKVTLDTNLVHYRQISISGTTRQNLAQYRKTLALLGAGLVTVKELVTGTFGLERTREAFETTMRGTGLKNVVVFP